MIKIRMIGAIFLALVTFSVKSQDAKSLIKKGDKLFEQEQYKNALPYYEQALQAEPGNANAMYSAGICYLFRFSKEKALDYILQAYNKDSSVSENMHYWLGKAYHQNYQFDEAIKQYELYRPKVANHSGRLQELERFIAQAQTAKKFVGNIQNLRVRNLGNQINSTYSDHSPVITSDEKTLFFTSRKSTGGKDEEEDELGEPFENIFTATASGDSWGGVQPINLNSPGHDATVQVFDNDKKLLIYKFEHKGDILVTENNNGTWSKPKKFGNINTKNYESSAFVTKDGKRVYYSTNHFKNNTDLDIYYVDIDEKGNFGKPQPVNGINTNEDEDAPFITPDGKTMYFSSRGHENMGGFDIFVSHMNENGQWSQPENLGYPINTPDDDVYYYLAEDGYKAYISSYRTGGFGEKDIYDIMKISPVTIKGKVTEDKTGRNRDDVKIVLISQKKTTSPVNASSSVTEGNYQAEVMSYNTYKLAAIGEGDTLYNELFDVPFSAEPTEIVKDILIPYVEPVVLDTNAISFGNERGFIVRDLDFNENQGDLGYYNKKELDITAEVLKKNPNAKLSLTPYYSKTEKKVVAEKRAKAVQEYLKSKGVNTKNITINPAKQSSGNNHKVDQDIKNEGAYVEKYDPKVIRESAVGKGFILRDIHFETAKSDLTPDAIIELDRLIVIMRKNPNLKVEVAGHTDSRGSDELNKKLSEARAKSAADYLVAKGIAQDRVTYKGYGKTQPIASNKSPEGQQMNRRTELRIIK